MEAENQIKISKNQITDLKEQNKDLQNQIYNNVQLIGEFKY